MIVNATARCIYKFPEARIAGSDRRQLHHSPSGRRRQCRNGFSAGDEANFDTLARKRVDNSQSAPQMANPEQMLDIEQY
jgi:hypothetical protein